ncbi:CBS domain-containing protein [Candidatus Saccharibacteria bacterium]|nr:CBS domain-containing protein [Candidatus Saccharibacteria bacterium]
MFTFLVIVTIICFVALIGVTAVRPQPNLVSHFELLRQIRQHKQIKLVYEREKQLPNVYAAITLVSTLLIVGFILLSLASFGLGLGIVITVVGMVLYPTIAQWPLVQKGAMSLYLSNEQVVLRLLKKCQPLFKVIRATFVPHAEAYHRFDSADELQKLIDESGTILSDNEKKLLVSGLGFKNLTVAEYMTPKDEIKTIKKTEFLGPLVLSEIHELGHSRLPVIGKDIHHVVGVLHLRDLLSLDNKKSVTAETAMDPKVFYVHKNHSLEHALAAFIETRHHLFIVINEHRETVGIITLEDVVEALIGRRIYDEADIHDNIASIAAHQKPINNRPANYTDV